MAAYIHTYVNINNIKLALDQFAFWPTDLLLFKIIKQDEKIKTCMPLKSQKVAAKEQ